MSLCVLEVSLWFQLNIYNKVLVKVINRRLEKRRQNTSEENKSNSSRLVPAREVVAFLSVGADKDKGVVSSYQRVLVNKGVGAS